MNLKINDIHQSVHRTRAGPKVWPKVTAGAKANFRSDSSLCHDDCLRILTCTNLQIYLTLQLSITCDSQIPWRLNSLALVQLSVGDPMFSTCPSQTMFSWKRPGEIYDTSGILHSACTASGFRRPNSFQKASVLTLLQSLCAVWLNTRCMSAHSPWHMRHINHM